MDISLYLILFLMVSIVLIAPLISTFLIFRNRTIKSALSVIGISSLSIFLSEKVHLEAGSAYAVSASKALYMSFWAALAVGVFSLIFLCMRSLTKKNH